MIRAQAILAIIQSPTMNLSATTNAWQRQEQYRLTSLHWFNVRKTIRTSTIKSFQSWPHSKICTRDFRGIHHWRYQHWTFETSLSQTPKPPSFNTLMKSPPQGGLDMFVPIESSITQLPASESLECEKAWTEPLRQSAITGKGSHDSSHQKRRRWADGQ